MFSLRWRNGLIGSALASLAGLLFWLTPLGNGLVRLSYDLPFLFRSDISTEGVTILYMDLESEKKLGQDRRASWDRTVHARMLEQLKDSHPKAVVFDVLFLPGTNDPAADQRLALAAKTLGNVVVAAKPVPDIYEGESVGTKLATPFDALREVVSWGLAEAADTDNHIREHNFREAILYNVPSMAWRAAQLTMTNALPEPFQPRWINYYGPPGALRHYSYYKIFETNGIALAHLSNQVVFVGGLYDIGFGGGKRSDDFGTPYTGRTTGRTGQGPDFGRVEQGRRAAGVEVGATAYLNFVNGDWLRRVPWPAEAALLLLMGTLLGCGLMACRPATAAGLGILVALAVAGFSSWSVWQTRVWFPWMIFVAVQVPCAVGWAVLAHTIRLAREKHSLEQALALARGGDVEPAGAFEALALAGVSLGKPANSSARKFDSEDLPTIAASRPAKATIPDHDLLRCIGKGAYGEVWLARDVIGTFHAVKIVCRSAFPDAIPLEREFNGIRKFTPISRSHSGFVHILHVGRNEAAGYIYYVMEPGDDETSGQAIDPQKYSPLTLARHLEKRGRLPLPECLTLCIHLADALDYLHRQQLIHRDIKPSNIIFVKGVPKFADIGLVTDIATKGRDVTYLGTPGRIAPEGPGTPASDVYSLGKIIYEAGLGLDLTRFPELPTALIESTDDTALFDLNRIILKACEVDARQRYPSAAALRDDLIALQKRTASQPRA